MVADPPGRKPPTRTRTRATGTIAVSRVHYEAGQKLGEEESIEKIEVPFFGNVEPGRVRVSGGVTRNLGDFNSARVDVMVELPCLPELSEASRVYDIASAFVDEKIKTETEIAIRTRGIDGGNKEEIAETGTGIRRRSNV